MTDDEAFIRAIVANPGDDAPRLIYADWLDERSDLRGRYLRSELEWVKKRSARPMELLKKEIIAIDPVWSARVSRPPVGVCCDHIQFRIDTELPTPARLSRLEKRLGIQFPPEYRAFLLNYNGGTPWPKWFPITDDEFGAVFTLFGVDPSSRGKNDQWRHAFNEGGTFWSRGQGTNLIPIGEGLPIENWTYMCLSAVGQEVGRVYVVSHWEDSEHSVRPIADSLPELLARFVDIRPDWVRIIQDGDVKGFKSWLKAGGDINSQYKEGRFEPTMPLLSALEWQQDEIVQMLLKLKATIPQDLWYGYQDMIPDEIKDRVKAPNFVDPGPFDT